jgi:trk system potassium uptake protein TrkH
MTMRLRGAQVGLILLRFAPAMILLLLPPLLVGLAEGEMGITLALLFALVPCLGASYSVLRQPPPVRQTEWETLTAATLLFFVSGLFIAPVFWLNGLGFADGVFEAVSGITSTGLTRYTAPQDLPFSALFMRAWSQWVGGYAIITLTVAFLSPSMQAAKDLGSVEMDSDDSPAKRTAAKVLALYVGLTIATVAAVMPTGIGWRDALLHGLTSISTGGFSAHGDSLGAVPRAAAVVLIGFALIGALAFTDIVVADGRTRRHLLKLSSVLAVLVAFAGLGAVTLRAADGMSAFDAGFIALSAQTTTGFSTASTGELTLASQLVLSLLMFIGADAGSTGGGIKVVRLLILGSLVLGLFPKVRQQNSPDDGTALTVGIILGYALLLVLGAFLLWALGASFGDAVFEMASSVGTVGLSAGVTGAPPHPLALWILIAGMVMGRVEVLLFAFAFARWRRTR